MAIATIPTVEQQQALRPLVRYFDRSDAHLVAPGEMVHDYYGVPTWLMAEYLLRGGAIVAGANQFQFEDCRAQVSPAPRKRIGSLEIGGARVEFTGVAGAIQAVLTELEWKTLRCGA